jgi:hypothetical protein
MTDSILESTKKILGIDAGYTAFDLDIMTHINSVFFTLHQLGIGPAEGFMIEDAEAKWVDFLGTDPRYNAVKTYVYLRVRLLFDPPTTSYLITALTEQVKELEWRLTVENDRFVGAGTESFWWEINDRDSFPADARPGDVGFDPVSGHVWRKL